jgi:hypothetical protein
MAHGPRAKNLNDLFCLSTMVLAGPLGLIRDLTRGNALGRQQRGKAQQAKSPTGSCEEIAPGLKFKSIR